MNEMSEQRDELYELLEVAKSDPPPMRRSVDDVVAMGRRRRVLRRARASAVVVAVAVAAAVTAPHVLTGHSGSGRSASSSSVASAATHDPGYPAALFDYGFRGYIAGQFQVEDPSLVTPGYQESFIRANGELETIGGPPGVPGTSIPGYSAVLTVYRPGAFVPKRFAGAQTVRIHGRTGYFTGYFAPDLFYRAESNAPSPRSAFAWQYADNAWAVISSLNTSYSRDDMVQIAESFSTSDPYPATVAFKPSWVPAGYVLVAAGLTDVYPFGGPEEVSSIRLAKVLPSFSGLTEPVDFESLTTQTITVTLYPKSWVDPTQRNPAPAVCNKVNPTFCYRMTPDGDYGLDAVRTGDVPDSTLARILDNLTFAPVGSPSAWFPATDAAQSPLTAADGR